MFGYRRVKYLGMIVDGDGVHPDPAKMALVSQLQPPRDVVGVRRFLGTIGYFRQFIECFANRAEPLTCLLRRGVPWNWGQEQQNAFEDLRGTLMREPIVLSFPHPEWPWVLDTDASGTQVAAVLQQTDPLGETPCNNLRESVPYYTRASVADQGARGLCHCLGHFAFFRVPTGTTVFHGEN